MKNSFFRLMSSAKFLTTVIGLIVTAGASWFARYEIDVSDAAVQQVAITVAGFFAVLLHAQGRADQGKEAAKIAATTTAPQTVQINEATINEAPPSAAKPPVSPKTAGMIDKVGLILLAIVLLGACPAQRPYLPPITHPIVDCVAELSADQLFASWLTRRPGWDVVKDEAIDAGIRIGGCAFARYLDKYLAPPPGTAVPPPEDAIAAKSAFEQYRNVYANNATFRFKDGDR